ncbi:MAG: GAF domain-containing protein, partial [Methylococcales bacterium]
MSNRFFSQWLAILCGIVPQCVSAVMLSVQGDGKVTELLAKWPEQLTDYADHVQVVDYALKINQPVCIANVLQTEQCLYDFFAQPVYSDAQLLGVVVLKVKHKPKEQQDVVFASLQQSMQWLALINTQPERADNFYKDLVSVLAGCYEQSSYREVLISLVTELTRLLNCERVAIGEYQHQHCQVIALSNSARFDTRANFMQKIANAMDEAIEQDRIMVFPDPQTLLIQRAHQELARQFDAGALLTMPMVYDGAVFGAVTLLRSKDQAFDQPSICFCEQAVALLVPFLALKKADAQGLSTRIAHTFKKRCSDLLGVRNLGIKLAVLSAAVSVSYT